MKVENICPLEGKNIPSKKVLLSFNENFKAHLETRLANGVVAFNHFNQKLDALKYNDLIYKHEILFFKNKINFNKYKF